MATALHNISRVLAAVFVVLAVPTHGALQGDPHVHDPSTIVKERERYWLFGTGPGCISRSSTDLIQWTVGPRVFATLPSWVTNAAPGNNGDVWAPDIIYHSNRFHL